MIKKLFPHLTNEFREARLRKPTTKIDAVFDSDTFNEIDDQFALVYTLLAKNEIDLKAVYAAPFKNDRSKSAEDGMELSYGEIMRILDKMDRKDIDVFHGSRSFMNDKLAPVHSDAAADLVKRAMAHDKDTPLYVMAIGAITNIASALLMEPQIIKKITVVWLGANPEHCQNYYEFNLTQDVLAAKIVQESGVPFVHVPCCNVAEQILTTVPEMSCLQDMGETGKYLYEIFVNYVGKERGNSKVIWDLAVPAWLLVQGVSEDCVEYPTALNSNGSWASYKLSHINRQLKNIYRDPLFKDFFNRLEKFNG